MLSYWEHKHFTNYDYLVIGGGIVGLSTALEIRDRHKSARIAVLERGVFPAGASTKNAGFACFGSVSEILVDLEQMGEEACRSLVQQRWQGLTLLRQRLGDHQMRLETNGGYELLTEAQVDLISHIKRINKLLLPIFKNNVFEERSHQISGLGLNQQQVKGLIYNPLEAQLDSGAMMAGLWSLAAAHKIDIYTGAEVSTFEESSSKVDIAVAHLGHHIEMTTHKLAICANAFGPALLPELPLVPGRGQVLITTPIEGLKLKGVFHYDEGFFYFRNIDGRVMLGGGRNLDQKAEETTEPGINTLINEHLNKLLKEVILPNHDFNIEHQWSGTMAFGEDKRPLLGMYSDRVGYALRLGGMGVALGSLLGRQMAELLCLKA